MEEEGEGRGRRKPGDFENPARQRTGRLIGSASRRLITCVGHDTHIIVYSGRQDLPFLALVPFLARPNRKSRSSIFLPSETKRKRLLRTLPKFTFLTLESNKLESAHILSLGCLCFKRKLPEVPSNVC